MQLSGAVLSRAHIWNGSAWVKAPGDAANGLDVDVTRLPSLPAGAAAIGSVSVSNFPAAQPVTDNAGSLTVDAPVGTPVFVRLSDGVAAIATLPVSLATNTPDVTDRDARLLGRTKLLDSAGTVIDAALKSQLPAALVGGRLSVDASGVAVPVTDNAGSLTVDAPVGTPVFSRLSDGAAALIGQKAMAASLPVVIASDQSAVTVRGEVAHDAVDSGNPQKVGARARSSDVAAVAADDRADNIATLLGKLVVQPYALPGQAATGLVNFVDATAADVIAAPGAGVRLYITEITVTNAHATVGTKVEIRDGTTVRKIIYAAALGGGASLTLPTPLRLTANTALTARCVTTGSDVDVSATGYTAAE